MKCSHYFKDKFRSKEQRSFKSSCSARSNDRLRVFSFSELRKATHNFNRGLKIGEGGFGSVYKGTIKPVDGKGEPLVVAIKKLGVHSYLVIGKANNSVLLLFLTRNLLVQSALLAEIRFLSVLEHPNVIKLIGYCVVDGERGLELLLVYEFMQNKSLADHLFNHAFPPLPWKTRLQILLGAAQALAYLHEGFGVQVIHRDFKASALLLDEKFNPKLSDFGLAREGPMAADEYVSSRDDSNKVLLLAIRLLGLSAAPEYIATGHLSYKSEVWGFGVVLYVILSGRRSFDHNRPTSEQSLVEWVKQFPANCERFGRIMDPRLENQYSIGAAGEIAKLADACLSNIPKERPKMSEVVERLKHIIQVSEEGIQDEDANELLIIKYALESFLKAERKGKVLLIVESDSTTAVKWIEDYKSRPRKLWDMLKEIDSLVSRIGTFRAVSF
ncbi:hypothetical protein V6N13_086809 [Hibiscus sabdariffa]